MPYDWEHKDYSHSSLSYNDKGDIIVEEDLLYNVEDLGYFSYLDSYCTFAELYSNWDEETNYTTLSIRVPNSKKEYAEFLIKDIKRKLENVDRFIEPKEYSTFS